MRILFHCLVIIPLITADEHNHIVSLFHPVRAENGDRLALGFCESETAEPKSLNLRVIKLFQRPRDRFSPRQGRGIGCEFTYYALGLQITEHLIKCTHETTGIMLMRMSNV